MMEKFIKEKIYLTLPYSIAVGLAFYAGLFIATDLRILTFLNYQDVINVALIASIFIIPQLVVIFFTNKFNDFVFTTKENFLKKFGKDNQIPKFVEKITSLIFFAIFICLVVVYFSESSFLPFVIMGLIVAGVNLMIGDASFVKNNYLSYFGLLGVFASFVLGLILFYSSLISDETHQICKDKCMNVLILAATSEYIISTSNHDIRIFKKSEIHTINLGKNYIQKLGWVK